MRVFLAGATGVIGRRLVPMLVADGHEVIGTTRHADKADALHAAGAEPIVLDALDGPAVKAAVSDAHADAIIHQLTALPARIDPRRMERDFLLNDRLRSEGTRHLVEAAQSAGIERVIAQSIAFSYVRGAPGTLHVEQDPLLAEDAPKPYRRTALALLDLERAVLGAHGVVLRYGYFYGAGSAISSTGSTVGELARRRFPVVGGGTGVWSFVHVDDASRAAVLALNQSGPAVYNVVDDDPARVADWLPALAEAAGTPKPWSVPAWIARVGAGSYGVSVLTQAQGAANALAKDELGWQPRYPSWREGFRTALG
jgi:nucleoside-diphosphate-sugar epimerase